MTFGVWQIWTGQAHHLNTRGAVELGNGIRSQYDNVSTFFPELCLAELQRLNAGPVKIRVSFNGFASTIMFPNGWQHTRKSGPGLLSDMRW
jgi:hypothetical protein